MAASEASAMTSNTDQEILDDDDFVRMWMMGMNSDRAVGRPKDWDGKEIKFDYFAFKFANWLAALPGSIEDVLEFASTHGEEIEWASVGKRQIS